MNKEIRCKDCNRYLFTAHGTVIASVPCNNQKCKKINQVKVVTADNADNLLYKFVDAEPKKIATKD